MNPRHSKNYKPTIEGYVATERQPQPAEIYGLTENEQLFDRVSHERFQKIASDLETRIHQIQVSTNNYGEFLFVTTSRTVNNSRAHLTFWGLGYHEYRERWISEEWFWYQGFPSPDLDKMTLIKGEVTELINQHEQEIASLQGSTVQTEHGKLFDMLADLTDDDGALSELEDLQDLFDDFDDF